MARARQMFVTTALLLAGSGFALSACGDDDFTTAFDGTCELDIDVVDSQEGDPAGSTRLSVVSLCNYEGSGFGILAGDSDQLISAPDGSGNVTITGTTVYTDEDGDQLAAEFNGTGNVAGGIITFSGEEDYDDGSGVFDGATGSADIEGTMNPGEGTGSYTSDGSINLFD